MHLFDQRIMGILLLLLLCLLTIVKRLTTGSVLDKPRGNPLATIADAYNLFFLLIAVPVAAILMITGHLGIIGLTHLASNLSWFWISLETVGIVFLVLGHLLMMWALVKLGGNYQVGGSAPRTVDRMITSGPYGLMRHPMYTAALSISLGISCLIHSLAYLVVFVVYLVLIALLVPSEEEGLRRVYGKRYVTYCKNTRRLIPFLVLKRSREVLARSSAEPKTIAEQ